jgi:outer membrane protein OmpA-like peptidoglycan-associated protein
MAMRIPLSAAALSLVLAAGCDRELGYDVNSGDFGNSTMNNTLIQSGEISATQQLQARFAREVPSTINFAFNSSQLDATARAILTKQADWIRQFPELRFSVYGHTDLVGSRSYNQALGKRRAEAVVSFFASQGISRSRLEALVSFGKTRPIVDTPGPELLNRRTVTEVAGFARNPPLPLNGKYAEVVFREYVASAIPPHPQNEIIQTQTNPGSAN